MNESPNRPPEQTASAQETFTAIFFEPGRAFAALRERPRFLVATLIVMATFLVYNFLFTQRIGYENIARANVENSPQAASLSAEDRERAIEMQMRPTIRALGYVSVIISVALAFAIGSALYMLGAMAMGGTLSYRQALSIWAYSSLPPALVKTIGDVILLFIQSPDQIDIVRSRGGLVHANLSLLVDISAHPVLGTLLGAIDLFAFYGLFLAATGMRQIARLAPPVAWMVVLIVWGLGVAVRLLIALLFNVPIA